MKRVLSLLLAALLLLPLCGCGAASAPAAETGRPSAAADDPEALCELGLRYLNGDGAEQSKERAVETLTQAAELGSAEAMLTLGLLQGEEGQYKKAAQWFRQAADLENPRAMYELAMLRWNGHYPNMNLKEAASLFRAARRPEFTSTPSARSRRLSTAVNWAHTSARDMIPMVPL